MEEEVEPREDVIVKDIDKDSRGEVVVGEVVVADKVSVGDDENEEGGAV